MTRNDIKYYSKLKQKKYRNSENSFLIEGENLIVECLKSVIFRNSLSKIFIRNDYSNKNVLSVIEKCDINIDIVSIDSNSFQSLSETVNSQGIIGFVNKPIDRNKAGYKNCRLIILLDSINDPGNLGTILRTCYWYNADKIIISEDSADIYNSKVLRASQGAVFHLDICENINPELVLEECFQNKHKILLTDLKAEEYVSDIDFSENENYLIAFGNESNGINPIILANENYTKIKIKGTSDCESLNVSVSAGIILDRFRNK